MKTLVLNASWEPLCVVPLKRAVVLILRERAVVVEAKDGFVHSADLEVPIPSVIRLTQYVRVPYRRKVPISRLRVLQRDNYECAYCEDRRADTMDHVKPKSQGGKHTWKNVVSACKPCNGKKANRTPAEAGMKLRFKPFEPQGTEALVVVVGRLDEEWTPWIAQAA